MAFMIAQRAFIKVYLITMVEQQPRIWISDAGRTAARIQEPWVLTAAKRNLRALHELVQEGVLYRTKQLKGNDPRVDFQEIVLYHFTDDGAEKAKLYKNRLKQI